MDDCPLRKTQNHCKKVKNTTVFVTVSSDRDIEEINCCDFLSVVFDNARTIQANTQVPIGMGVARGKKQFVFAIRYEMALVPEYLPKLRSKNRIFLRNCVFLI